MRTFEQHLLSDPSIQAAAAELQGLIRTRFPEATFSVGYGEDPVGVYLRAIVDVEDTDEVIGLIIDRLVTMQVDEELPIYVIPSQPPERIAAMLRTRQAEAGQSQPPGT